MHYHRGKLLHHVPIKNECLFEISLQPNSFGDVVATAGSGGLLEIYDIRHSTTGIYYGSLCMVSPFAESNQLTLFSDSVIEEKLDFLVLNSVMFSPVLPTVMATAGYTSYGRIMDMRNLKQLGIFLLN